ncbi:hypothetical protein AB0M29_05075 [Streptomyces sp. NPDC051976]|uniref:hypothetical protein n=1 Tax=Streptomyces sp. NPDC051976 TaxID=3154947 RepID=UPI0034412B9D
MEHDEVISRGLGELAEQAGPPRIDVTAVTRLVRRRRKRQGTVALAGCAAVTVGVLGSTTPWDGGRSAATSVRPASSTSATHTAPAHCGAPPPGTGRPPHAAPSRSALDAAAGTIEQISGGGKNVTKGGAKPGTYSRWYGGVAVDGTAHEVILYRIPGSGLDQAVCSRIREVTVELRDAVRSMADTQRLADRISREVALGAHPGFRLFTMALGADGTLSFTSDHPDAAREALRGYGPGVTVTYGQAVRPD